MLSRYIFPVGIRVCGRLSVYRCLANYTVHERSLLSKIIEKKYRMYRK